MIESVMLNTKFSPTLFFNHVCLCVSDDVTVFPPQSEMAVQCQGVIVGVAVTADLIRQILIGGLVPVWSRMTDRAETTATERVCY